MPETLYLVDGSSYIFRAFYAIRNLTNKEGMPTNALYGFTQMVRKLLEQEDPDYVGITFDPFGAVEPNFRTRLYPEYKANRDEMPHDLRTQLPYFPRIAEALHIPLLRRDGVEADDLIATLTRKARAEGLEVVIVSGDKDMMQLLEDEHVHMIDTMRDRVFTPVEAEEKFGVPPAQIKYVMALAGDSSDNVPGVPGIGPKTGGKLIAEFGDLETLLANIDKVSGKKRKENLEKFADQARLSLELVTLKDDCEVELNLDALRLTPPNVSELTALFEELDFGRPLKDIRKWMKKRGWEVDGEVGPVMPKTKRRRDPSEKEYRTILTVEELDEVIEALQDADRFAIDLETTSLDPLEAVIVGLALAWEPHAAVYIPVEHRYIGAPKQLALDLVLERLRPLLEDETPRVVAQHAKYELIVLERYGVELRSIEWDTMLMSYLLDPGRISQGLDALASDFLKHEMMSYSEAAGAGKNRIAFEMVDVERATRYAAEDADVTLLLCDHMEPAVVEAELRKIHDEIEIPLTRVLARMEQTGVRVDRDILRELSREFEHELTRLQSRINALAGCNLNPNSPVQLREVLFDRLDLPVKKRTKSGPSTDQSVLEQLSELHELPGLILEFRSYAKLKGTYVDALPQLIRSETGRIHTDFNQAVTATGRLSSSNPNLQNIPIRTREGRQIRKAFVPEPEWKLICADYSQIELRLMAHMSGDPKLVEAFRTGTDVHALTASQIFDVPMDEVTSEQRAAAKTINFGVMYGMGANRLARELSISRDDAKQYIANYFARYQGVELFFESLVAEARRKGYAETIFGRRRILEQIDGYGSQRAFAERVAVNMPIQGTAADIIKLAMINLDRRIQEHELPMRMLLQVHDELVLECAAEFADEGREIVVAEMEGVLELDAPLVADCGIGDNWLEAK